MNPLAKQKQLHALKEELLLDTNSPLYLSRKQNSYLPILGEGNPNAQIMFIGEAPGKNEAITGKPFVGAAGKILDSLLMEAGITRKRIYITSVVNDRPPNNRDPKKAEIIYYSYFLNKQIEIIKPKVIATLGRISTKYILNLYSISESNYPISQIHGETFQTHSTYGQIVLTPLFHPASVLYRPKLRPLLIEDFKKLGDLLKSGYI